MKTVDIQAGVGVSSSQKLAHLMVPDSYPFRTEKVALKETHMSWVFLTDQYVFKLKKPVVLDLLDFSTLMARRKNCLEELRLNLRLADSVYLGVLALTNSENGQLELNGNGKVVDWLIWMKRLPEEKMLDVAIATNSINKADLRDAARVLADFYSRALPVTLNSHTYISWLTYNVLEEEEKLLEGRFNVSKALVKKVADALVSFIYYNINLLLTRAEFGKVIEAHGDLRPEHIYPGPQPAFIDALEFCRCLRILDIAEELSFLELECEMAGAASVGRVFTDTYRRQSGDSFPDELMAFYKAKRALLRARLCIRHILTPCYRQEQLLWEKRSHAYLTTASKYADKFAK